MTTHEWEQKEQLVSYNFKFRGRLILFFVDLCATKR